MEFVICFPYFIAYYAMLTLNIFRFCCCMYDLMPFIYIITFTSFGITPCIELRVLVGGPPRACMLS